LNHISSPFCSGYFGDGVLWTICPRWPRTLILPISASWVARITGVSFLHQALRSNLCLLNNTLSVVFFLSSKEHFQVRKTPSKSGK
jgi:hypothetical protein